MPNWLTDWPTDAKCPQCGSCLISNGRRVWYSLAGGGDVSACDYGIAKRVTVAEAMESEEKQILSQFKETVR